MSSSACEYLGDPKDIARAKADRLPPHSSESEQGVLGCILWDAVNSLPQCMDKFKGMAQWAYDLRHQAIYDAMRELHAAMQPVDLITLSEKLKAAGLLDNVGGLAYLSSLQDTVPSAANLPHYLDIVHEKAQRRALIAMLTRGLTEIYARDDTPVSGIIQQTLSGLDLLLEGGTVRRERHIRHIIPGVIDELEKYSRGRTQLRGLPTGFGYLDKVFQGIAPTHYIVIAGRPGDGKSSLAMNIIEYLALRHEWWEETAERHPDGQPVMRRNIGGLPIGVFSLEMDSESLVERMMFGNGQVSMGAWNTGMADGEDVKKLTLAAGRLGKAPIYIDDASDQTIEQIESRARRMVAEHGIKMFVLDYIQLLDTDDERLRNDRVRELTKISKAIVRMKKRLKVPWIVLAQMNRNIEQSEAKRVPILSDLKDCGALEQDADKVALLYRPSLKDREEDEQLLNQHFADAEWDARPALINAMVAKNRRGPTGRVKFIFFKNQTRFEDLREWQVRNGGKNAAKGEAYKPITADELPSNEELGV
jgi:replicative DNA helicase